jgi:cobalt ABC transporter, permease protein CbiQ
MWLIDRTAYTNRWRSRHPAEKLLLAGGLMLVAMTCPPLTTAPFVLTVAFAAATLGAGIAPSIFLRVLAIPAAFMIVSAPMLALTVDFDHGIAFAWSAAGGRLAAEVTLRALAATACLALLALTTPIVDLLWLLRRLGVPRVFLEIMLVTYRMTFVLAESASTGARAQASRLGYGNFRQSCRSLGQLAATLLQNALGQARRLEAGLAARGYEGDLPVLHRQPPISLPVMAASVCVVGAVATLGTLVG